MVEKDLLILIAALAISGFISYKTFRWVIFEEITPGTASLFLAFALLTFLAIANYDLIRNWKPSSSTELSVLENMINELNDKNIGRIDARFQKQEALIKSLVQSLRTETEKNKELATQANTEAQNAIQVARRTRISSTRLHEAEARALWDILTGEFYEIEHYLQRWEKQNFLARQNRPVRSKADLQKNLQLLGETVNLPDSIKDLYLKREEKYEMLRRLRKSLADYSSEFKKANFPMPPPPRLPLLGSGEQQIHPLKRNPALETRLGGEQESH